MTSLISVKIPTYNCAEYLIQTINSILNQKDFDLDLLEIEVIDDCSTLDNPKEVVEKFGQGRVSFYRQPTNVGAVKNFNTCIERSNNKYVHILHGDDFLETSFYSMMYEMIIHNSSNIFSSRCYIVNENSEIIGDSQFLLNLDKNIFLHQTPIQFASVIFDRMAATSIGGFDEELIHLNDRDMWLRLSITSSWCHSNKILTNYRVFEGNDTSKLIKSGNNLLDHFRFYKKHKSDMNISFTFIHNKLFEIFTKQSVLLNQADFLSNKSILISIMGNRYYFLILNRNIKKFIKRLLLWT
jgi:glycosyltransferase involved in cell wall biosynthesis